MTSPMTHPTTRSVHSGARILRHFAVARSLEVIALQASPFLGAVLGGFGFVWLDASRLALLLLGSLALTAHVFVFNDWAGHSLDIRDPRRASHTFSHQGISRRQVARFAIALLILSIAAFAALGMAAMLSGAAIASLSFLYSFSQRFGKGAPVVASLHHLFGGALHFLLGYTLFHSLDSTGIWLSLFFGLVFAAGHLTQEVRDYEGDRLNGIRTTAVMLGCRRAFLTSFCLFTAAYSLLTTLAALGLLPGLLLWSPLLWALHAAWFVQALRQGLGYETALWMQRRYRLLFALLGLAMLAR